MPDPADQELDLEIAGQKIRTKNYRLLDLIWLPVFLGVAYCCLILYQHDASAKDDKATLAATLKESNANIAAALKENNSNMVNAIKEIAVEQRRSTNAIKEVACLNDPAMQHRNDARDFCKRMSRDDR